MTGAEKRHCWLMIVYSFGALIAIAVAWFPAFLCRAGSGILLVGLANMIWQSRNARRQSPRSVLFYAPFLAGTNLIWMGLSLPVDAVSKALADCAFLGLTTLLLALVYVYNSRALKCVVRPE